MQQAPPSQPPPYPPAAGPPPQYYPPPTVPPAPKSRTGLIIALVVVVVLVVVLAWIYVLPSWRSGPPPPPTYTVYITAVNWQFNGATNCWTSGTGPGGGFGGGDKAVDTITLSYTAGLLQPSSCTVQSVSVSTAGFSIVSGNTPLVVTSGGTQTLSVTIQCPNADYNGVLSLVATVTSP